MIRHGTFRRADDSRDVQRYRCRRCGRTFSTATFSPNYRQQLRRINPLIRKLFCIKGSLAAIARTLGIDPKTVARRLVHFGRLGERYFNELSIRNLRHIQFDEMQSSIHTKCKPVSIPIAVCAQTRRILALEVASMPAQHPLIEIALRKYGPRADDRPAAIAAVLTRVAPMLANGGLITTDKADRYPGPIRRIIPHGHHRAHKSRRARTGGLGELKRIGFDPIFSFNHTAARVRDYASRMVRQTWCNSKRPDRLKAHLVTVAHFHNEVILPMQRPKGGRRRSRRRHLRRA